MTDDVLAVLVVNLCGKRLSDDDRKRVFELCRAKRIFAIEDNCHFFWPPGGEPRPDMEMHSFGFGKVLPATAGGALIARVAGVQVEAELARYAAEPIPAALSRFRYFMAKFGNGVAPAHIEEAY